MLAFDDRQCFPVPEVDPVEQWVPDTMANTKGIKHGDHAAFVRGDTKSYLSEALNPTLGNERGGGSHQLLEAW